MTGIHFLGNDDFIVRQGDKGLILSLIYESKGMTLVLFYSTECPHCDSLINKFKQLPSYVNGCKFAMVNVNRNMSIVERSKNTIAPITYVPDVILYINGSPYVRYDGPHDIEHLKEFIVNVNIKLKKTVFMEMNSNDDSQEYHQPNPQPNQNYQPPQPQELNVLNQVPAYTIGKPLYGEKKKEKVCYLNFNSAYIAAKS